jgi:hypothetical protein
MRTAAEMSRVRRLLALGLNDCEIARRTGIPRTTVRDWRRNRITAFSAREEFGCARCGRAIHDPALLPHSDYAYLLGMYLGDGCISVGPRGVAHLRIACDSAYSGIVASCMDAVEAVMPENRVRLVWVKNSRCVNVSAHSKAWPCLLPQHGPGRKHERSIRLESWQQEIVDRHPRAFLSGLIHSDGNRAINRVRVRGKRYAYRRYQFTNVSDDIKRIFCDTCDQLGLHWTVANARNISIARRADVAFLDTFIGPKA